MHIVDDENRLNIEFKSTKKIIKCCIDKTKKDEPFEKFVIKKDFVGFEFTYTKWYIRAGVYRNLSNDGRF
ncbi:hypothetical protein GCM10027035_34940 [Emticicia sediminis]